MKPKKLFSFVLAAAMTISLLPTFTITAEATATEKNITLGAKVICGYDSTNGYDYIYYGAYPGDEYTPTALPAEPSDGSNYTDEDGTKFIMVSDKYYTYNPIKWRVLDTAYQYDRTDTGKTGMLLFSEYALARTWFENETRLNNWTDSWANSWCGIQQTQSFGETERKFIFRTSSDDILNDNRLFFLSKAEVENYDYFSDANARKATYSGETDAVDWWLRSPVESDDPQAPTSNYVYIVKNNGDVSIQEVTNATISARPAFNLDATSVLFTSAAKGSKKTDNVGTLSANTENTNDEYKLTMKDGSRTFVVKDPDDETIINIAKSAPLGGTVTLNYKNAITGTNEYISAVIVDAYDEVLYYGQVKNNTSEQDGTVSVPVPEDLPCGTYDLRLFNEQINGDGRTDFSSDFQIVTLNVTKKMPTANDFTFTSPIDSTYDGKAKFATVTAVATGMGEITVKYYDENETQVYAPTDVGKYTVKINVAEGSEYAAATNITRSDWEFEIEKASSQTSAEDVTVTYGEEFALTAIVEKTKTRSTQADEVAFWIVDDNRVESLGTAAVTYANGGISGTATLRVNADKKLNIGTNTIKAEYGGNVNLNGSADDTITVILNPKTVGLEWDGYSTRTYDGTASNVTARAVGIIGNDAVGVTVKNGDKINANPVDNVYPATATALTGADAAYYKLPSNAVQIYKIEPKVAEIEWNLPTDFTYDGNEKEVTATVKNAVSGDAVGVALSGNKGTAATSYTAKVEALDNANYTLEGCTNLTCDWTISPKKINAALTIAAPVKNATPQTSIDTDEYTATVSWAPSVTDKFAANTEYTATITLAPKSDYTLDGIAAEEYTVDGATAVTKAADENIVTAVFPKTAGNSGGGGGSSASGTYTVTFETNGGNTITSQKIKKSGVATEPTTPTKEGYIFDGWYTDKNCTTAYDFDTKVTKNITLYAKWVEDEMQEPTDDKKDDEPQTDDWSNPFTDVKETDWFFDSVKYANENGLMSGMTSDTFAPNENITRGMFVTVLYRAEGEPLPDRIVPFADVRAYMYCANAINWARRNNIVSGMTETEFAPDESITREQIAVILYRYAKFKGYDVSVGEDTNILSYADFDEISEYAISAVQYAVGSGLMKGKTERTFHPKDNATRAEIATILSRFIENNK